MQKEPEEAWDLFKLFKISGEHRTTDDIRGAGRIQGDLYEVDGNT